MIMAYSSWKPKIQHLLFTFTLSSRFYPKRLRTVKTPIDKLTAESTMQGDKELIRSIVVSGLLMDRQLGGGFELATF